MKERWAKLTNDNIDMEGNYMKALGSLSWRAVSALLFAPVSSR